MGSWCLQTQIKVYQCLNACFLNVNWIFFSQRLLCNDMSPSCIKTNRCAGRPFTCVLMSSTFKQKSWETERQCYRSLIISDTCTSVAYTRWTKSLKQIMLPMEIHMRSYETQHNDDISRLLLVTWFFILSYKIMKFVYHCHYYHGKSI